MNTENRVFNKLAQAEKVELSAQKVELSNLSILNNITIEANKLSIRGDDFKKNKRALEEEKNILNINSKQIISGSQKQIDIFKAKSKELGIDVTKISEYKNALKSIQKIKDVLKETS